MRTNADRSYIFLNSERLYRPADLVRMGLATEPTLARWRCSGAGPKFVRIGNGRGARIGYWGGDLREWLNSRRFASTSDADANGRRSPK